MYQSDQINELASALSKAQGEIHGAKKDSANPFFKSSYADLASVMDAIREPFAKNGLAITQTFDNLPEGLVICTTLMHSSGQWIKGTMAIHPVKQDPQGVGSATTYARRYSLAAIAGVAQVDDDGNAASHPQATKSTPVNAPKQAVAAPKPTAAHTPVMATENDRAALLELLNEKGFTNEYALGEMTRLFQKTKIAQLTQSDFKELYKTIKDTPMVKTDDPLVEGA